MRPDLLYFLIVAALASVAASHLPSTPVLHVHLRQAGGATEFRLGDGDWQTLTGEALDSAVAARAKAEPDLRGMIHAGPHVPHAHVILAIDAFMKANVTDLTFSGTPRVPGD